MLKAVISHNEQATIVELPMDRLSLQYELSQIGIRRLAKDIPIMDEEDQPISVKLYSESDIGQNLAMLFRPSHSLEDANVCAHAVVHARPEVQDEIEQSIVYGQYHSPQAVLANIRCVLRGTEPAQHRSFLGILHLHLWFRRPKRIREYQPQCDMGKSPKRQGGKCVLRL